jgi:hypothetical protein
MQWEGGTCESHGVRITWCCWVIRVEVLAPGDDDGAGLGGRAEMVLRQHLVFEGGE